MTPTTLVMAYYENAGMLARQFETIRSLPRDLRDLLHVVIVDDGSPNNPARAEDLAGVPLQIYRMKVDVRWNQDACRNIGVNHSETEWVFITDMDHIVPEPTWREVLMRNWDKRIVYQFRRVSEPDLGEYKLHPNTWFMSRKAFDSIGGYDERFAGYYGTDGDFRDRVRANFDIKQLKRNVIRVPRTVTPDASTTSYLRKQPEDREAIARIKGERDKLKNWQPLRFQYPYERVFP